MHLVVRDVKKRSYQDMRAADAMFLLVWAGALELRRPAHKSWAASGEMQQCSRTTADQASTCQVGVRVDIGKEGASRVDDAQSWSSAS
jgi:hypothetical protein